MKAWHVQGIDGENNEIVFAETRGKAIQQSEARAWNDYTDVRAKRAKYADNLENKSKEELIKTQLENGWWFECHGNCRNHVTIDDMPVIIGDSVYCSECGNTVKSDFGNLRT